MQDNTDARSLSLSLSLTLSLFRSLALSDAVDFVIELLEQIAIM